jgi:hypothetical protein
MAGEETTSKGNITNNYNAAQTGLNMDSSIGQIPKGKLTYALNANVENFDSNSINYQNEEGNELCLNFPQGYQVLGNHFIPEKNKHIFFLINVSTGESQIGYMSNNDCVYHTHLSLPCLNFNVNYPIQKIVHKITNCTTEIYWTDGYNQRRYLDLDGSIPTNCNELSLQPDFDIPQLSVVEVVTGGELTSGTYQFAIQYGDVNGIGRTSFYSVTNPLPIGNTDIETLDFNYTVNRSIILSISNIDTSGFAEYYNIAVIKTINNIQSVELVGTYFIDSNSTQLTYTGQNRIQIRLSIEDIFEKYPYYDVAQDVTAVQDQLVWDNLTSNQRINYQSIASQITLKWQSYRIPATENYANEINAANLRGYLRDEVYAFEICFLLKNGKQTDSFHIPGRASVAGDLTPVYSTNQDYIGSGTESPKWKIYNTGSVTATSPGYSSASSYKGPYQYGEFSYWESIDVYPSDVLVWGALAGQPIRHHKFPDILVSPAFQSPVPTLVGGKYEVSMQAADAVYPIGVRIDTNQVQSLINASGLSQEEKDAIAGFKIVRGNRSTNKSIVAKGMLRNVGKYTRQNTDYFYPNYPYNDLNKDPFILEKNNAYNQQCIPWIITVSTAGNIQITNCYTGEPESVYENISILGKQVCSLTKPVVPPGSTAVINVYEPSNDPLDKRTTFIVVSKGVTTFQYVESGHMPYTWISITVQPNTTTLIYAWEAPTYIAGDTNYTITVDDTICAACYPNKLDGFSTDASKFRQVFNSPETSFGQPTLGSVLKLENVMFGAGIGHFVQVQNNSLYKLITKQAQYEALLSSYHFGNLLSPFDATAMFTTYQAYLTVYINGIIRKNFAYSFNSVAQYDYAANVNNSGFKQRLLDKYQYLSPGFQSTGDTYDVNNFQRESSIYLRTDVSRTALPYPSDVPSISGKISEFSRFTASSQSVCGNPQEQQPIKVVSYYASIKNIMPNQWGQMYTYETIDTGFQVDLNSLPGITTIFGGDTFISRFAYKTKLPFFIDNRVGAPDDSEIFYDELGNIGYPQYWHSSRSILYNFNKPDSLSPIETIKGIISIKAHILDCGGEPSFIGYYGYATTTTTTTVVGGTSLSSYNASYNGKMYQFAYGIPYFYCESSINTDLRQAFNNKEGNFYPRVSTGIPDSWLQQINVPIALDNTYYYNVSYSKQNIDNYFSHLPADWSPDNCQTYYPFRAIYSDTQSSDPTNKVNNWLVYRPVSFFDFPQNYGNLVSLDGIQNRAVLARFENKSLLYNTMLTIDTSNPQAAYIGNPTLFRSSPPIDFAETDLGYVGSQNKMLLKIPQGQITIDAKRGQIFLISGNGAIDLTAFGSGVNRFMTDHLAFEILRFFPEANIDNAFSKVGLTGVYDSKYDRVIITKLDYIPQPQWINKIFYGTDDADFTYKEYYIYPIEGNTEVKEVVQLTNRTYFCNRSWTLSFNMNTKSWVSFHSYLPNYYIAENNFFYSGLNSSCDLAAIAAIEVAPTTTTTTSTAPPTPTPQWYQITSCVGSTVATSQSYQIGTYVLNSRVTISGGAVYTVTAIYNSDPGGVQIAISSTGLTGCPAACDLSGTAEQL